MYLGSLTSKATHLCCPSTQAPGTGLAFFLPGPERSQDAVIEGKAPHTPFSQAQQWSKHQMYAGSKRCPLAFECAAAPESQGREWRGAVRPLRESRSGGRQCGAPGSLWEALKGRTQSPPSDASFWPRKAKLQCMSATPSTSEGGKLDNSWTCDRNPRMIMHEISYMNFKS